MLSLKNLCKSYVSPEGDLEVINKLNFSISKGKSLAIVGESGSGKSTLLHLIAGLERPSSGSIEFEQLDLWTLNDSNRAKIRREKMAVIFQQFNLIPSLTVKDNIEFHAKIIGTFDPILVKQTVTLLKLDDVLKKYPEQISGGQQQRSAIARAVVAKPVLILADEPTGNLDEKNSTNVIEMLTALVDKNKTTLIVATHSQAFAASLQTQATLKDGKLTRNVL